MNLPTISILIPTLNSIKTIGACLDSVLIQDYPKDKLEIVVADGGSKDGTLDIVKSRLSSVNYQLTDNPLKTGETGKARGLKLAKNDIIAFIDSDNILPEVDWLRGMVEPFQDQEIVASEPLYYTYRKIDPYITRYCALLGMNDPLCLFLGNYDRYCTVTGRWTEVPVKEENKGNYLKIEFSNSKRLPTVGANGFFIRRCILKQYPVGDYLFDMDIIYSLASKDSSKEASGIGESKCSVKIAKTKLGIIHIFSGTARSFVRKQTRRIRDYYYYRSLGLRKYPWDKIKRWKIIRFVFSTVVFYPLLIQCTKGYSRKKDSAWFYHPIACWLTCIAYGMGIVRNLININPQDRSDWGQM